MDALLITCEHGGNRIPAAYRSLFIGRKALLATHRGYDAGALAMAEALSISLRAPLVSSTVSRLLVDLNRSIGNPRLFSEMTRSEPAAVRKEILDLHYRPYRDKVEGLVTQWVKKGRRVIHLSSHSFTPELHGHVRSADAGLLYDPARSGEVELCARWKAALAACSPVLRVRRNYPYAGKGDGLTAHLRRRFPPGAYIGIELEINQSIVSATGRPWTALRNVLATTFHGARANGESK